MTHELRDADDHVVTRSTCRVAHQLCPHAGQKNNKTCKQTTSYYAFCTIALACHRSQKSLSLSSPTTHHTHPRSHALLEQWCANHKQKTHHACFATPPCGVAVCTATLTAANAAVMPADVAVMHAECLVHRLVEPSCSDA